MPRRTRKEHTEDASARGEVSVVLKADPALLPKPKESEAKTLAARHGAGPHPKRIMFAWHLAHGMLPIDAYRAAGYLIQGDNSPLGTSAALTLPQAQARIDRWLRSRWIAEVQAEWRLTVHDRLQQLSHVALPKLLALMEARKPGGDPDNYIQLKAATDAINLGLRAAKLQLEAQKLARDAEETPIKTPEHDERLEQLRQILERHSGTGSA